MTSTLGANTTPQLAPTSPPFSPTGAETTNPVDLPAGPEKVANVLAELRAHLATDRQTNLGFPSTFDLDFTPLLPFFNTVLNNVGDPFQTSAFPANTKHLERDVLHWFATLLRAPQAWWGVCTDGGTQGIEYGLLHARTRYPNAAVLYSAASHYSVAKLAAKLRMRTIVVDAHADGQLDHRHLARLVRSHRRRPIIVVATVGTTMTEAVDDVAVIRAILAEFHVRHSYVHADAALSGLPLALLPVTERPGFDLADGADSISISAHKFLGCPFPAGIYLTNHPSAAGSQVDYIATTDTTLPGSRSGHAPLLIWYAVNTYGISGLRHRAEQARKTAAYAVQKLTSVGWKAWRHPHAMTVVLDAPPQEIRQRWRLATSGGLSHLITMPGVSTGQVDLLAQEIAAHTDREGRSMTHPTSRPAASLPTSRPLVRRGYPVFVAGLGAVVEPLVRVGDQWRCQVIAAHPASRVSGLVVVGEVDLAAGLDCDHMDHSHPDMYALAWLAGVHEQLTDSRAVQLARVLAGYAHTHNTTTIRLDPEVRRRLLIGAHLHPPGFSQLLALLTDAGLLTWTENGSTAQATITLTLPSAQVRSAWRRRRGRSALEGTGSAAPAKTHPIRREAP